MCIQCNIIVKCGNNVNISLVNELKYMNKMLHSYLFNYLVKVGFGWIDAEISYFSCTAGYRFAPQTAVTLWTVQIYMSGFYTSILITSLFFLSLSYFCLYVFILPFFLNPLTSVFFLCMAIFDNLSSMINYNSWKDNL